MNYLPTTIIEGNLGDAPQHGNTKDGRPWARLSVAVGNGTGTHWFSIFAAGPLAQLAADKLIKGQRVTVNCEIRTKTDDNGTEYMFEALNIAVNLRSLYS